MGYKALGFIVWQGGKWYARRKLSGTSAKLAIAGLGAAIAAGALVAGRQATSREKTPASRRFRQGMRPPAAKGRRRSNRPNAAGQGVS
jgi:hypothetical protein